MATTRLARWRAAALVLAIVALGWIAWQTIAAGGDVPAQHAQEQTQLSGGSANDKRLDGKSWTLVYDSATVSNDGSLAEIEHVHDGTIMREGKPFMHMTAKHVSANLTTNDFVVTGPVWFAEVGGEHRRLDTVGATYSGRDHVLHLDSPTTIRAGVMTVHVATATVDFTTGETKLGRIVGTM